jgi:GxxExxY protein
MDTNVLFKEEAYEVMSCAFEVVKHVGPGLSEKIYENALAREFDLRGIPDAQQLRYPVEYKGVIAGEYIPDLIAYGKIVVETKTIDRITQIEVGQVMNCLKITGHRLAIIINFKNPKLEYRRVAI